MSKIFYDHLIRLDELDKLIKDTTQSSEEKEELWVLVDEIVHHRVIGCIMSNLPHEHHTEFLERFEKSPYDATLMTYLSDKIKKNIEELIKQEIGLLAYEILQDLRIVKKTSE